LLAQTFVAQLVNFAN